MDDLFRGLGIEVELKEADDFLKVKETLTRLGVASKKEKKIFQSCHILHKRGKYAIMHFKEMFILDGKDTNISDEDISRRNRIVSLLEEWGLVKVTRSKWLQNQAKIPMTFIKVLPYSQRLEWQLCSKYTVGEK